MDEKPPTTDLRCERVGLLLSLRLDGEVTPEQAAEIEAHLPECADCRAAAAVDEAVRARLGELAEVPSGFTGRVLAAAERTRIEARAQNRMLLAGAAAAVFVAIASVASFVPATGRATTGGETTATAPAVLPERGRTGRVLTVNLARGRVAQVEER